MASPESHESFLVENVATSYYSSALSTCDTVKRQILFFLGKTSLLLFYFLTQTVDFSSPGPKEFDYFCFKQYKRNTILTKYILTDFSFF